MTDPFDIILADPPWRFASNSEAKPGRNAFRHYPCMRDEEIAALPVRDWSAKDALLFMWTTGPMRERSMSVPRAWGFRFVSELIWVKDRIGTGYWSRGQHEVLLICRRGRFPCPRPTLFPSSVIHAPRREHSRKPAVVHETIEARLPDTRKLELFARETRPGWVAWGNEADKFHEETPA